MTTNPNPGTGHNRVAYLHCRNGHLLSVLELEPDGETLIWDNDNADDHGDLGRAPDIYTALHQLVEIVKQRDTEGHQQ